MSSPPPSEFLTISSVAEIAYCARSFWYEVHNGRRKARNPAVEEGFQEDQARLDRHKEEEGEAGTVYRGVWLEHQELGLRGQVDSVRDDGELTPTEYRHGRCPGTDTDRIAMALIALALEDMTGREVSEARLFFMSDRGEQRLAIDAELRAEAVEMVAEARRLLDEEAAPENPLEAKCQGCSWFSICCPDLTDAAKGKQVSVLPRRRFDRVLYVQEWGAKVRLKAGSITVSKDSEVLVTLGLETVDQVVLVGKQTHITTPALRALTAAGIDLVFMTKLGRYEGRVVAQGSRNPRLKRGQHRRTLDPVFRLKMARELVAGKIHNQRTQLQRLARDREDKDSASRLRALKKLLGQAPLASRREVLLGYEGQAAKLYFRGLDAAIQERGFQMARRTRRPPRDPFNALLSFAYGLLTKEVEAALLMVGLDPTLGVYHSEVYGRPALALDMVEEFRPVIGDAVALRLVRQGIVSLKHFEQTPFEARLTAVGRRRFFEAWEAKMNDRLTHPVFQIKLSYRRVIEAQARMFAKALVGDIEDYRSLRIR